MLCRISKMNKRHNIILLIPLLIVSIFFIQHSTVFAEQVKDTAAAAQPRVIVSTDIGGTDPDDFQSMVHLLVYADMLDIEGLISSPYGKGRKSDILDVIDRYELDYENLKTYSDNYPTPDALKEITKQGATGRPGRAGFGDPTEGSEWIIRQARRDDPRPLHLLVWGGIEDLARALHDAPDILPKLRVYFIGGPNKKWSFDSYHYIATHHKKLWIIESNATYRGWFEGGNQSGVWGNSSFVSNHIAGHGALGNFFNTQLGGQIKMGDTPSVARLLQGSPEDPAKPSWGGRYVRAWPRPHVVYHRTTTSVDIIEQFGVLELVLPIGDELPAQPEARLEITNQMLTGAVEADSVIRFRLSPKKAQTYSYTIHSNIASVDGKEGSFTSFLPPQGSRLRPLPDLPNWWTDDPSPEVAEGVHIGAKTVNQWREAFLSDFAKRWTGVKVPLPPGSIYFGNHNTGRKALNHMPAFD